MKTTKDVSQDVWKPRNMCENHTGCTKTTQHVWNLHTMCESHAIYVKTTQHVWKPRNMRENHERCVKTTEHVWFRFLSFFSLYQISQSRETIGTNYTHATHFFLVTRLSAKSSCVLVWSVALLLLKRFLWNRKQETRHDLNNSKNFRLHRMYLYFEYTGKTLKSLTHKVIRYMQYTHLQLFACLCRDIFR